MDEKELREIEIDLWRANRESDGGYYDRVLRDDALLVSRYGVADKSQVVPMISENRNPFTRTDLSDMQVRFVTDDTAYLTYRCDYTSQTDDGPQDYAVLATTFYARENDGWRLVLHQQTAL